MPLSRLIWSNSEVRDKSPVWLLISNFNLSFNPFEPSASTRFPLRYVTSQPSTSKLESPSAPNIEFRTPNELFRYSKISKPHKRKRKGRKSIILTSTPNKEELEMEESKKKEAQWKKDAKKMSI
ncbi:hypothetical protein HHI36_013006 [Cryptolaemus montrouzieri]|uniref:Uncharacterized protein n=1 Tax=Cryptolaemus montrouzieri TaxID=559131 RepID=A0ABD2NGI0_9CUCU